MLRRFIDANGEEAIRTFKYKGGSDSITYKHLWSPLAEYLLQFIPLHWAPNAITVGGYLLNLFGNLMVIAYSGYYEIPRWCTLLFVVCLFSYQTLDNIDGKQARRTGSSSPLGLLMDHGCDAFGVGTLVVALCRLCGLRTGWSYLFLGVLPVSIGFFMIIWLQYHHKQQVMTLGRINAVDYGLPFCATLGLLYTLFGYNALLTPFAVVFGIPISFQMIMKLLVGIGSPASVITSVISVGEEFTDDRKTAFSHLQHIGVYTSSVIILGLCVPYFNHEIFIPVLLTYGLVISRNTCNVLLCITAKMKYYQFQLNLVLTCLLYPVWLFAFRGSSHIKTAAWGGYSLVLLECLYFAVCVCHQVKTILGIRIFRIKSSQKTQ